ncbi:uncharacterized protein Z520_11747 [Fonsecaea multimorphosa CBS 102226]|uniref:Uncharacterized protein n=1 Tax=Fonsecaea multimorphosa CBS 102226 TaxID=1442371 RepID=A0A0D2I5M3_9EURO|nr:uncharacterized protein Z520_11747 [Fonsecaea multimorphosa CBS 102226]KIX92571.1 hypothetical protein Z520_11747 [Fonsecaea multimorphosa CBS 102226]
MMESLDFFSWSGPAHKDAVCQIVLFFTGQSTCQSPLTSYQKRFVEAETWPRQLPSEFLIASESHITRSACGQAQTADRRKTDTLLQLVVILTPSFVNFDFTTTSFGAILPQDQAAPSPKHEALQVLQEIADLEPTETVKDPLLIGDQFEALLRPILRTANPTRLPTWDPTSDGYESTPYPNILSTLEGLGLHLDEETFFNRPRQVLDILPRHLFLSGLSLPGSLAVYSEVASSFSRLEAKLAGTFRHKASWL